MKLWKRIGALLGGSALAVLGMAPAAQAIPGHITYTGDLMADNGLPYTGEVMAMARLFSAASGGTPIWEQDLGELSVMGGVLQADLMGAGLWGALGSSDDLWLEFEIDGETLAPRQKLSSVPYAAIAGNAEMLGGTPAASFVTEDTIGDFIDADALPTNGINQVSNGALKNFFADVQKAYAGTSLPIADFDPFVPGPTTIATFQTGESAGSYFTAVEVTTRFTLTTPSKIRMTLTPPAATGVAPIVLIDEVLTPANYFYAWSPGNVPEMGGLLGNPSAGQWKVQIEDLDDSVFGSQSIGQLTEFSMLYDTIRSDHMVVAGRLDVQGDLNVGGTVTAQSFAGDGSQLSGFVKIRNVTVYEDSTRVSVPSVGSFQLAQFTVNKKSPTSILLAEATLSGKNGSAGALQGGWKLGSGTEVLSQSHTYTDLPHCITSSNRAVITGHTTTGPQSMSFRFFSTVGGGNKPFDIYNPNGGDDNRLGQTRSIYVVWEIEP